MEVINLPKKIDWIKIKRLSEKGFSVKEISKEMDVAMGTLYNNKERWAIAADKKENVEVGEVVAEVLVKKGENTPLNNASTTKEVIEVKEFYKSNLNKIKGRIVVLLSEELDNNSYYQIQLLEKLVKILKETRQLDYIAHDILTYKDLASLEIMVKKLEMEAIRMKKYRRD